MAPEALRYAATLVPDVTFVLVTAEYKPYAVCAVLAFAPERAISSILLLLLAVPAVDAEAN